MGIEPASRDKWAESTAQLVSSDQPPSPFAVRRMNVLNHTRQGEKKHRIYERWAFIEPTTYGPVASSSILWLKADINRCLRKVGIEPTTYGPVSASTIPCWLKADISSVYERWALNQRPMDQLLQALSL